MSVITRISACVLALVPAWAAAQPSPPPPSREGTAEFAFVSTTGNNAANCLSAATACRTIAGAVAKAGFVSGDTINVGQFLRDYNGGSMPFHAHCATEAYLDDEGNIVFEDPDDTGARAVLNIGSFLSAMLRERESAGLEPNTTTLSIR